MASERTITIKNKLGIHVRPAAQIAELANKYNANIVFTRDNLSANAKSIVELLTLGAVGQSTLTIKAEGPDAEPALTALTQLIEGKFGEE